MNSKRIFNGLVAALLGTGALEVVTGIILLPFYNGSSTSAYSSAKAMESSALLGFVQSLHHWLSASLIVFGALTVVYGLVSAAYRMSSKKLWVGSVILVLLFLLLQLTGHILPWDQHAVRSAVVETGIAQGAPIIGDLQANFLRGGSQVGPGTLGLWYWCHIALLSVVAIALGVLLYRRVQALGWSPKATKVALSVMVAGAVVLAVAAKVQLGPTAAAVDSGSFEAKPEWYILPMHTLLGLAQGISPGLAFVGSMVVPGLVVALILLAPWLDKRVGDGKGRYGSILGLALLAGLVLFGMSANDVASPNGPNVAAAGAAHSGVAEKLDPKLVALGEAAVGQNGCTGCHRIDGKGGNGGPVLNGTGTRHPDLDWQMKHIANPKSEVPGSTMPAFGNLSTDKVKAIAEYLMSLK